MEKDLHKRLEEAADRHCKCDACLSEHKATGGCWKEICPPHSAYIAGAEYGYKEAIAQAKEWLETNIANQVEMMMAEGPLMMSKRTFLADFEAEMLKLWEDKK